MTTRNDTLTTRGDPRRHVRSSGSFTDAADAAGAAGAAEHRSKQVPRAHTAALDRLFTAAVELFGERGYAGTTVDEIVERAGVAKGTVYYHFRSKSELVSALLDDGLRRLAESFRSEIEGAPDGDAALRALVHAELAYIQHYQAFSKLVMSEMWRADRDWRDSLRTLREQYVEVFAGVLRRGMAEGAFRADLDAQTAASTIFGMIATAALDWLVFDPQAALDDVERRLLPLVLGAVRAPG
jgi:AcrR family transcriptional regulator